MVGSGGIVVGKCRKNDGKAGEHQDGCGGLAVRHRGQQWVCTREGARTKWARCYWKSGDFAGLAGYECQEAGGANSVFRVLCL